MKKTLSQAESTTKTETEELLALSINQLLVRLNTSSSGLSSKEADRRLKIYGYNELAKRKKRAIIVRFLLRFRNPLVIILLVAGLISGFSGEIVDSMIIFSIVLLSVILDFYQEFKAEQAAELLKERVSTTATVLRDGIKKEVKFSEIVPGDIIYLSAGDLVPADSRVLMAKDLSVDQSALTGESFPVEKTTMTMESKTDVITEWNNCLFLGSSVISGTAVAVVLKTGNATEYGKIVQKLVAAEPPTEFERALRRFGYLMMQITFLLVLFVFFINALFRRGVLESLLFSVALAVGLTPELLPMILSINLSRGAISMSKKGAIVKRLASIQNLGCMDVLCSDKTGTLTENKVVLVLHIDVEGNDDEKVLLYSFLNSRYETGLKSPLDEAILRHQVVDIKDWQKIDEVPFDFTRRRVSVIVRYEGQRFMIAKGDPETVIKVCSRYEIHGKVFNLENESLEKIRQKYYELSSKGFRILGISYKNVEEKAEYSVDEENEMILVGFIAFMDPPKETAREALRLLKKSGIELKIVTGDNELVTRNICEQLGLEIKRIVLGSDIAKLQDDGLSRIVEEANVFARVTPPQKDRIINALMRNGHVVGFLGDGINDASSMKIADVSISVDNAVDVAKESADIILLQKDLGVLLDGVLEGRKTFGNAMKYIMMGTSSNFGNMFSAAFASLFLPFLPMLPTQILLNNLLYDLSEITIPTDNVDEEYIEKPERLNVSFIRRFMVIFGPISSIFDFLTFFIMLHVFNATEPLFQTAWFLESLFTQTLVVFIIRTRRCPFFRSKPSRFLLFSGLGIPVLALIIPFTPLGTLFGFVRPPSMFLIFLLGITVVYLMLVEIVKKWFYKSWARPT
ncbi:MAG: magnesium-translocating P-type ATPase [Candidatus Brockarchaeota archaeon]|nr:magnesium-translocating P-type ATPase [Candidatus Brockarchaeota archaeon]MBO3808816.1 magnesium-translocating P-type ATPase [Candidatus Brockarchaeota archaeon]